VSEVKRLILTIIIVAAMLAIMYIALGALGIVLPQWAIAMAIVVLVAGCAIIAVKILSSL
jgi:hypothetical protein